MNEEFLIGDIWIREGTIIGGFSKINYRVEIIEVGKSNIVYRYLDGIEAGLVFNRSPDSFKGMFQRHHSENDNSPLFEDFDL